MGGEMAALMYPDLGAPPRGWTVGRQGAAIRLVPPGAYLDMARAHMIVSPLVPWSDEMLRPGELILAALNAELARGVNQLVDRAEPVAVEAGSGLKGVRIEARIRRPDGIIERRAYVMYRDRNWLYGVHYIADEDLWAEFAALFDQVSASMLPMPVS